MGVGPAFSSYPKTLKQWLLVKAYLFTKKAHNKADRKLPWTFCPHLKEDLENQNWRRILDELEGCPPCMSRAYLTRKVHNKLEQQTKELSDD